MSDTKTAFLARVSTQNPGECWLWTSVISKGYGVFSFERIRTRAHRWAYLNLVGPVPDGLVLDHVCHTRDKSCAGGNTCLHRRCVNPAHLEPVTHLENVQRGRIRERVRKPEVTAAARTQLTVLQAARRRVGLTQGQLGALIGCSQAAISRWEQHQRMPGPEVFARWSALLANA